MHDILELPELTTRPAAPRTYRPHRQRARPRVDVDIKVGSLRRTGDAAMEKKREPQRDGLIDRNTLCLPDFAQDDIIHGGDERFNQVARQYFPTAESNATERLVDLKSRLQNASTHDFWGMFMEEICEITGSQSGFVSKRMLVDDQDSAVEMPELGEPGSCLMATAFYVNNGSDVKQLYRDYRYHAHGTPCAHMRHEKVFIIPERMDDFIRNNPNEFPWKHSDAYIGVPLFSEGKNFAHFGLIWSAEGAVKRKLGWSFIEMMLHSLEDMILQRIVEGRGFGKDIAEQDATPAKVIPLSAITASQTLKPYARSLSHELRTPMQGVIGMLDIVYSTVLDAVSTQSSDRVRGVFTVLKNHIETVQESSRRAVEAADNLVHAYDLNMQMPETPLTPDSGILAPVSVAPSDTRSPTAEPAKLSIPTVVKRTRPDDEDCHTGRPRKRMFTISETEILRKYYPADAISSCGVCGMIAAAEPNAPDLSSGDPSEPRTPLMIPARLSAAHHKVDTRVFMQDQINEALRNEHPTSEVHVDTDLGEIIEFKTVGPRGEVKCRTVSLTIAADIPDVIIVEESHLQFALQKVLNNAIKFTDNGDIAIAVRIARNSQVVEIAVKDTGCGIAEDAQPRLFTPHFQEDDSIRRSRDGLGLSLFNAKACVRKNLGGDLTLEMSATDGPSKGSEFLISLPISIFNLVNIEAPLVRTPSSEPTDENDVPQLPTPGLEFSIAINELALVPSGTVIPSDLPSRPIAKPKSPHKRAFPSINPNLATQHPLNILIAEDNEMNRRVGVGALKKLGYSEENITLAFDGLEAVECYTASMSDPDRKKFDIILMDIWMPRMDGYEATNRILNIAQQNGVKTKVIAVTADITEDCRQKAVEIGMQGLLAKPYKVLDMENLIVEHFSSS